MLRCFACALCILVTLVMHSFGAEDPSIIFVPTDDNHDGVLQIPDGEFPAMNHLPGDVSGDGVIGVADVDLLAAEIASGAQNPESDLSGDGTVNLADLENLLNLTSHVNGDADFNGIVDIGDFVILSTNFGQADMLWSQGDFNADSSVRFPDFLILAQNFGLGESTAQQPAAANVPEPIISRFMVMLVCLVIAALTRRVRAEISKELPQIVA